MPNEKPATVLIAEHIKAHRWALRRTLERAGYRVLEAASGQETLGLIHAPADLVLLDVHLRDMGAFEVCRRLRSHPDTSHIPVIQTSARPLHSAEIIKCFESGADDYFVHPIPDDELLARVRARIRLRYAELRRANQLLLQHAEASRTRLARLKAALEIALLGVWEFTAQLGVWQRTPLSAVTQFDNRCRELFGIGEERPMAMEEVFALVHPEDRARVKDQMCLAIGLHGSGIFETECRIVRPDGTERCVAMRAHEITPEIPESRVIRFVGTLMDITDRKRTQDLLIRSEKVAALGRMAATLAHEINNPLTAVVNTLFLAKTSPNCREPIRQYLQMADEQIVQICHITRQALGFYRERSTPTEVSIGAILDETLELFRGKIQPKRVHLECRYDGETRVVAVRGELRQVFSNLIANSLDAIADHGTIKIRVSRFTASTNCGGYVRIAVADDGRGMEPSAMSHLFEPLFTTKGAAGTGLGLWVSKQIIDKNSGSIRVHSSTKEPHRGTVFSILLPAAPANSGVLANSEAS